MIKSVYIHIPFCTNICSYCDFCKQYKDNKKIELYLNELEKEIEINYKNELISTIYIGGGTPSSLNMTQLKKLFEIIKKINLNNSYEFTFECNIEDITLEKAEFLIKQGVNRISLGIQTFNEKHIKLLNRKHTRKMVFKNIEILKKVGFTNINIDLMYALPFETLEELEEDIDLFLSLDVNHISTYSLIIEDNTIFKIRGITNVDEEIDAKMYELICKKLTNNAYIHYEISNFSKKDYESKHNLTYWNNEKYYGFGLGASGYINNIRYTNTKSLSTYLKGNYIYEKEILNKIETMENEFMLGLRKLKGISKKSFKEKYIIDIKSISIINRLLEKNLLLENNNNIYINPKYVYVSNEILEKFIGGINE